MFCKQKSALRALAAAAFCAALAACGGGGSGNDTAGPAPVAPQAALTIVSFAPAQAGAGATVTVTGTGFTAVTGARVGGTSAAFTIDSPTQLRLVVPAGATSGRIELIASGAAATSAQDLTIVAVPVATGVTPQRFVPPARVTVTGTALDRVAQVRLNAVVLAIASQSPTTLELDVPANASTGFLTLVATDGAARQSSVQVTVDGAIAITSVAPATVARGDTLTVTGTNLDRATRVEFTGGASATIASRTGSTAISVAVPVGAQSGPVTVVGNAGERIVSANPVTIVAPLVVDPNASYSASAPGAAVTISGSGLSQVTGVTVLSTPATISARSDTSLTFAAPAGVACGPITLRTDAQPAVPAGSLVVGAGCSVRVAGIEFAQVLAQAAGATYQRIVPGKRTLVRAYVVSTAAGTAAPTVRLTGFIGTSTLGTVAMTGPATLPQLAAGAAIPGSLRYDEAATFNAVLPDEWVRAGLSVRVDVDPDQQRGLAFSADATPVVGTATGIDLVLVPLVSGSNVPTMPALADVVDELVRRMPIARNDIRVAMRAAYVLTSVTDGVDTSSEWSSALSELEQLRRREAPARHYYGMVRPMVSAGTAGIGYVNRVGSSSPSLSSMGWDATRNWRRTMAHELGHNFSRPHAPCGGVASPDPDYPYANGALGTAPLYESLLGDILSPSGLTDIMGYCSGAWFSDYNYREVQRFIEAQPRPAQVQVASQRADAADDDVVLVSGVISARGVAFAPVQRLRGRATPVVAGEFVLRLRTVAGPVIEVPFDAPEVDHADGSERHFFVQLPHPGDIASLHVLQAGVELARAPDRATAQRRTQAPATRAASTMSWREAGGDLHVSWNAGAYPFLTATHVDARGARTVLAIDRTGGTAALPLAGVAAGGTLEFSLSDGLRSHLVTAPR